MKSSRYDQGSTGDPYRKAREARTAPKADTSHATPAVAGNILRGHRRRQAILQFLIDNKVKRGYGATLRQIGEAVGLSSVATVHGHIQRLAEQGKVKQAHAHAGWVPVEFATIERQAIESLSARLLELVDELGIELEERAPLKLALLLGEAVLGDGD